MNVTVVLPTYDESQTIREVVALTLAVSADIRVLVVDDNSPDGTGAIADDLAAVEDRVDVLHRSHKQGLGPAYIAGFRRALATEAEAIVEMDADLSHDPADIARMIDAAARADLVIGSRYVPDGDARNWSRTRRALSRGANSYARTMLRFPIHDSTSGFRLFRRAVLETLPLDEVRSEGYAFQIEMAWRTWAAGFAVAEIPITFVERRAGASKMSRGIIFEAAFGVLRWGSRRARPPAVHARSVRA